MRKEASTKRKMIRSSHVEPVYFCFSATLRIAGNDLDIDKITRKMGILPTHSHRKGERRSRGAPPWQHDMWSYTPPIDEAQPLHEHIMALWNAVRPHMSYLRNLKQKYHVDIFCGYRSNSDTAGFDVDYQCLGLFAELEVPFGISVIIA
jgi:hypothetical protein